METRSGSEGRMEMNYISLPHSVIIQLKNFIVPDPVRFQFRSLGPS